MIEYLLSLFDPTGFPARWDCGFGWKESPHIGWLHIVSDVFTWLSYLLIPLVLFYFARKRGDVQFPHVVWLFCTFIFACGTVHLIEVIIFWHPIYRFSAYVKLVTAVASVGTVVALVRIAPAALALPSLASVNRRLESEIERSQQVEKELRFTRDRLELAVAGTSDGLWEWEVDSTDFWCNPRFAELLGIPFEKLVSSVDRIRKLLHPDDSDSVKDALDQHLSRGQQIDLELRLRHQSGEYRWFRARGDSIRDDDGKSIRIGGSIQDVTDLKREQQRVQQSLQELESAHAELAQTEQRFHAVFNDSPVGKIIVDATGHIVMANSEIGAMFEYASHELTGQPIEVLIPDRFHRTHVIDRNRYVHSPTARDMGVGRDVWGMRKNGTEFPVEIGLSPIKTHEGVFVIAAVVDITTRKQAVDELKTTNAELQRFAYIAAHDLRSPMRGIAQIVDWVVEEDGENLSEESRENIQLLCDRLDRMERLLDDLLRYSTVGTTTSTLERTDTSQMLQDVIQTINVPDGFHIEIPSDGPVFETYRIPLQHVLLNLINNALKHHDRDEGRIDVTIEEDDSHYIFNVRDDGPGIPAEFHERIFEMFQTLKSRDVVEGSGMGLAIVAKIVNSMGGTIEIDSKPGAGSTFVVKWPKSLGTQDQ